MTVVTAEVRKIKLQGQKSADEDTPLKPLISGMVVEEGAQQSKRRIQRNPNNSHLGLVSPLLPAAAWASRIGGADQVQSNRVRK